VPVGSKVRLGAELTALEHIGDGAVQVTMTFTFEVVGAPKPACVAEIIFRYVE
jgi:acyl dehydratase